MSFINKCRKKVINSVQVPGGFQFSIFHMREAAGLPLEEPVDCYADQEYLFHHFRDKDSTTDEYFAMTQTDPSLQSMPMITDKYLHQALV